MSNPFANIIFNKKPQTGEISSRQRWYSKELGTLINSDEYKQVDIDFQWVTLLLLHQGLRPSEACQLRTDDIVMMDGEHCIKVSDAGDKQRLKNTSSRRIVPIHHHLLALDFLNFVNEARRTKQGPLFHYRPTNQNQDWSRQYCNKLGLIQTKIGMKAGSRPSAYSFRHTFIDELKQREIEENIVAELVGHTNQKITFGRYGKKYNISLLKKYVDIISYDTDCTKLF